MLGAKPHFVIYHVQPPLACFTVMLYMTWSEKTLIVLPWPYHSHQRQVHSQSWITTWQFPPEMMTLKEVEKCLFIRWHVWKSELTSNVNLLSICCPSQNTWWLQNDSDLAAKCNSHEARPLHSHTGLEINYSDLSLNVNLQYRNHNYCQYTSKPVEVNVK